MLAFGGVSGVTRKKCKVVGEFGHLAEPGFVYKGGWAGFSSVQFSSFLGTTDFAVEAEAAVEAGGGSVGQDLSSALSHTRASFG